MPSGGFIAPRYPLQISSDSGVGSTDNHAQVLTLGPEVTVAFPHLGLLTSLLYHLEVYAKDGPQGDAWVLPLTHAF